MTKRHFLRRFGWLPIALVVTLAISLLAGHLAEQRELDSLRQSGRTDLQLRQDLLDSEIARYRLLPLALADDRDVGAAMAQQPGAIDALNRKFERLAKATGAAAIYAILPDGEAIAASNWREPTSFVGASYSFRNYFIDAVKNGEGSQFTLGTMSQKPGLYLSGRTQSGGVIVVKIDFREIERQWRVAGGITYAADAQGVIIITSRPEWRFRATRSLSREELAQFRSQIQDNKQRAALLRLRNAPGGLVSLPGNKERFLQVSLEDKTIGGTINLLIPVSNKVEPIANYVRLAAGLLAAVFFAALWGWRERAQRRAERMATAEARNTELEQAVTQRTAALEHAMEERVASEKRAAELREGLRQANRLATLGQVTASVAHETAQPVAAIRNYANNGETLLERGEVEQVRGNLQAIARLTERIGAVTSELRGFARKNPGVLRSVSLAEVVDGALLIMREQLSAVTFTSPAISPDLMVMAGKVRLEQVLVNILQNALEALDGVPNPKISVMLDKADDHVALEIRDNGPGVAPDIARDLFTPFVTSRASGLGLGLVIAHDIMVDFGGSLRLIPSAQGACFRMELKRP
ncbi:sensor histidine kinase [Altererythrobacter indicus]|uniref:histidine kinase n=1 Tax=Altericroceibacterium indicum TaxID=374177 RepID=A0A845AB64_9SPHN|nr:ATP-binding protein [Altericroceibacterium indicum]MXP26747.1 sensor histidine kinase [Altericroceibacterium indicum]